MEQVEQFILKQPEVQSMVGVLGFSFSGQGQNAALAFVTLKDWSERHGPGQSAQEVAGRAFGGLSGIRDAFIFPEPTPIPGWVMPAASPSDCKTAAAQAMRHLSMHATSCWAWPRRARC